MNRLFAKIKKVRSLGIIVLAAGLIQAGTSAGGSDRGADKVDRFLDSILKATSLDQVSLAFQKEEFTEAEIKRIEAEVNKEPYRKKLTGLKAGLPPVQFEKLEVTKSAPSTLIKSPSLTGPEPADRSKTASSRSSRKKKLAASPSGVLTISQSDLQAITSRPGGGTEARIRAMDPSSVQPGQAVIVSGYGFGRGRGSVEIIYKRRRYACDIESWDDTGIRAVVPDYLESIIGDSERGALLWVKPAGQSLGPTRDIRLRPSPAVLAPEILSLGSKEIQAGQDLDVRGRHFGRAWGTAWCVFGRMRLDLEILDWTETHIRVRSPDDAPGIAHVSGTLYIRVGDGKETSFPVGFLPVLEEMEISTYVEVDSSISFRGNTGNFELFRGNRLANGWRIVSSRLERIAGRGTFEYTVEPRAGTSDLYQVIALHSSAFSSLRVASRMTIRGPRGTNYI